ncbi:MAG: outer membrane beta-barrel protein [Flavobacteriales bacterium]|nr:outer membrane beta-barrel protein [Flavobacteriales bacterium]MBT4931495.1 outer membrane beta-barrel protein [Flavobacteriales bacterium]MBT6382187.1 outer membrane beta-barrel protein [Flavobacteriales bacterium]
MRIKLLLLALAFIFTLNPLVSTAQENDMSERKFRFGLHGSPNFGWIKPNIKEFEKSGLQPRFGFGYGLMMDYRFSESPNYLFSTGVNLSQFGGGLVEPWDSTVLVPNVDTTTYYGKLDRTYQLQYVNIPIMLKMRTNEIGYMSYFASVGFDLGVRTRAFANDNFEWTNSLGPANEEDVNIQDDIGLFRVALNLTGGGEFNLTGNTNVYIGVGWHNTLLNMFQGSEHVIQPDANGFPETDGNGVSIISRQKKAVPNYISLDLGLFF